MGGRCSGGCRTWGEAGSPKVGAPPCLSCSVASASPLKLSLLQFPHLLNGEESATAVLTETAKSHRSQEHLGKCERVNKAGEGVMVVTANYPCSLGG